MSTHTKSNFFICSSCHKEQNLDQSIHINRSYCVRCYNKEQIWLEIMSYFKAFQYHLQEKGLYTKIRKQKIQMLKEFSEMLLPLTLFDQSIGEIEDSYKDLKRTALRKAILSLQEDFGFHVNENAITHELVEKLSPIFEIKKVTKSQILKFMQNMDPFIDNPIQKPSKFITELRRRAKTPSFTRKKQKFEVILKNPFKFKEPYLIRTVKAYVKEIKRASSQRERFFRYVRYLGKVCQFQTLDDLLAKGTQKYVKDMYPGRFDQFNERIMREINQEEDSHLIPNIAKYIMDNHELVFESWFTKILPFDKSRFMVSGAKTGSRTDFIVRLQYTFRSYELKSIEDALRKTANLLLQEKSKRKILKIRENEKFSQDEKELKIAKERKRLQTKLEPKKLQEFQDNTASSYQMVARYLLINGEKAFNMILDNVIQYHYKRLKITTPVKYITNVLESGANEKRKNLKAFYLIQSREW